MSQEKSKTIRLQILGGGGGGEGKKCIMGFLQ